MIIISKLGNMSGLSGVAYRYMRIGAMRFCVKVSLYDTHTFATE